MSNKKYDVLLLTLYDLHVTHPLSLFPINGVKLDSHFQIEPSSGQKWLWNCWMKTLDIAETISKKEKRKIITVLGGDLKEGKPHNSQEPITDNSIIQSKFVRMCLDPVIKLSYQEYFIRGTSVHDGPMGQDAEAIAEWYGEKRGLKLDRYSEYEINLIINGIKINFMHHIAITKDMGVAAIRCAKEIVDKSRELNIKPPDIAFRGHAHRFGDSGLNNKFTRVIVNPCWKLGKDEYTARIAPNSRPDIGAVITRIDRNGDYEIKPLLYEPPFSTKEYVVNF